MFKNYSNLFISSSGYQIILVFILRMHLRIATSRSYMIPNIIKSKTNPYKNCGFTVVFMQYIVPQTLIVLLKS